MIDVRLQMFNAVRRGLIDAAIRINPDLEGKRLEVYVREDGSANVVEVDMYSYTVKIAPKAVVEILNDIEEFELITHMFKHVLDVGVELTTLDARVKLGEDVRDVLFSHVSAADNGEVVMLQYQDDGSILVLNKRQEPLEMFTVQAVKAFLDADERTNKFVQP